MVDHDLRGLGRLGLGCLGLGEGATGYPDSSGTSDQRDNVATAKIGHDEPPYFFQFPNPTLEVVR